MEYYSVAFQSVPLDRKSSRVTCILALMQLYIVPRYLYSAASLIRRVLVSYRTYKIVGRWGMSLRFRCIPAYPFSVYFPYLFNINAQNWT